MQTNSSEERLKVLVVALHIEPKGYIGGGWVRLIELLRRAKSNNVDSVLLETTPTFNSIFNGLNYEVITVPYFLNRFFIGRIIRCILAVIYGIQRVKRKDIKLVLSPVELPECVLQAYIISRITKIPWTAELHLIPLYSCFWKNEERAIRASSLSSLFHENRKRGNKFFPSIFSSLILWLTFRSFRKGVMLAPSKSVIEDMQNVDKNIVVKSFFPGNGIALERIDDVKCRGKLYDAIYVGVLTDKKGVFDAIYVWRLVVKKKQDAVLAIIGRGNINEIVKIKSLIEKFELGKNIRFPFDLKTGAPTLEDVWEHMEMSKMLIHLSVSDTWPQVIGEALACGLPVVTYDLRPQRYAFGDCPAVFRVPVKNFEAFASKILEILPYFKEYGEKARDFAKKYTWDAVMRAEKQAYLEITE